MAKRWLIVLLVLFLLGCTKTEVVSEKVTTVASTETPTVTQPEAQETNVTETTMTCTDTDSGIDSASRGTITGTNTDGTTFELTDKCYGSVFLVEYYCDNNQQKNQNFKCENGCKSGVCV